MPIKALIAEVFYLADYIQRIGSGTIEMVKQCKQAGLPEPEFVNNRGYEFRTILGRDLLTESALLKFGLNERQRQAIKIIKKKGKIALSDLQEIYENITRKTLYRDLQALVNKGILKAQGDRKGRKLGDFLVSRDKKPWFLVEVKLSSKSGISKNLVYFQDKIKAKHAFQVVFDLEYVAQDCFKYTEPIIVPARTFLTQLV